MSLGWSLVLMDIRPTTWKEIRGVLSYLGRDDFDQLAHVYRI
jgi:hypothetical protein